MPVWLSSNSYAPSGVWVVREPEGEGGCITVMPFVGISRLLPARHKSCTPIGARRRAAQPARCAGKRALQGSQAQHAAVKPLSTHPGRTAVTVYVHRK
eukprot:7374108-Prymnesium_polylepis.1